MESEQNIETNKIVDEDQKNREQLILNICGQECPIELTTFFDNVTEVKKIGEGIWGEVYQGFVPGISGSTGEGDSGSDLRVFKIIPVEGTALVNDELPKKYDEVLPEIIVSKKLTLLQEDAGKSRKNHTTGLIKMFNAFAATGLYPISLLKGWEQWSDEYDTDNDPPNFPSDQKYIIFEYEHGGEDAGHYTYKNAKQAFFGIMQVIHALAAAECEFEFEHRDMHANNILVKPTKLTTLRYKINGKTKQVPSDGIVACIIDFTYSRIRDKGKAIFLDMKDDEEMFISSGAYQFDIYRMMRDVNGNEWTSFKPKTNILWLHHLIHKLLGKRHYQEMDSNEHLFFLKQLYSLKHQIMNFDSCYDFVSNELCNYYIKLEVPRGWKKTVRVSKSKLRKCKCKCSNSTTE